MSTALAAGSTLVAIPEVVLAIVFGVKRYQADTKLAAQSSEKQSVAMRATQADTDEIYGQMGEKTYDIIGSAYSRGYEDVFHKAFDTSMRCAASFGYSRGSRSNIRCYEDR